MQGNIGDTGGEGGCLRKVVNIFPLFVFLYLCIEKPPIYLIEILSLNTEQK